MTERLYYTDALSTEFDATVVSVRPADGRFEVVLDRTLFYPTSGGQAFDTGRLGDASVVDVFDGPDGAVVHVADAGLEPNSQVRGAIDWPRRFDHMQQHSGQHVLSAAFIRTIGVETTSVHLGADVSTIDLAREVTRADVEAAEAEANRAIWDNRPVVVRFVTSEEAAILPLRKPPARAGRLRLVDIADFDLSACGGTHVPETGRIGIVLVSATDRAKGGTRVTFVCGERARRAYGALRDVAGEAARVLGVSSAALGEAAGRARDEQTRLSRLASGFQRELAEVRAARYRADAAAGSTRSIVEHLPDWDQAGLVVIARAVVSEPGWVVVLLGGGHPSATPVVVARSPDVALDANAWLRQAVAALGGRGGGRGDLAQGGLAAPVDRILAFVKDALTKL